MKFSLSVLMDARAALARRRTFRTWSRERRAGFTLIEVLAVMAIVALVAGLAITMIPGTGRAQLKALTLDTAALMRRERLGAILTGRDRQVFIDGEHRRLIGDGGSTIAIPRDVVLDILGSDQAGSDRRSIVRFHADGASSGAVLKLSREGVAYEVRVNWYTGAVKIVAP
jgi:general secretion pathway protein H